MEAGVSENDLIGVGAEGFYVLLNTTLCHPLRKVYTAIQYVIKYNEKLFLLYFSNHENIVRHAISCCLHNSSV